MFLEPPLCGREKNECFWSHWVVRIYLFLKIGACFPSHPFQRLFLSKTEKLEGIQFLFESLSKYSQTFLLKDDQPSVYGEWPHGYATQVILLLQSELLNGLSFLILFTALPPHGNVISASWPDVFLWKHTLGIDYFLLSYVWDILCCLYDTTLNTSMTCS